MAMAMVMTTMLIMDMMFIVMMAVIMGMSMGMIMRRVVVRFVIVRFVAMRFVDVRFACRCVRVAVIGIGAAFGIERRLDLDHARAKPLHHRLDDMVAPYPQAARRDLGRQMTVAEMPGDPNQMLRIGTPDLGQRLRRRDDLHQPAVVEHQRIAAAQHGGMFEIQQEFQPTCSRHRHPTAMAIVEIEHNRIGRRLIPAMGAANLRGADHADAFPFNGRRPFRG